MRRSALALALALVAASLAGCSSFSDGFNAGVSEEPVFEYGPCSTQQECFDATYPMASEVGDAIAQDCVAANTKAVADMIAETTDANSSGTFEATVGDCKVILHMTDGTTLSGEVYDMR